MRSVHITLAFIRLTILSCIMLLWPEVLLFLHLFVLLADEAIVDITDPAVLVVAVYSYHG